MGVGSSSPEDQEYQALPTNLILPTRADDDFDIYSFASEQEEQLALLHDSGQFDVAPDVLPSKPTRRADGTALYNLQDVHTPYRVFRKGLLPNSDTAVRIGPVLGRITDKTAVVLLEVEGIPGQSCECAVNFARVVPTEPGSDMQDELTWATEVALSGSDLNELRFAEEGSVSISYTMEPRRPHAFAVQGLMPATSYLILLSGVSAFDMKERIGRFRTLPTRVEQLRLVAISGHATPAKSLGASNPWQCLTRHLRWGPDVAATLHLGSTVDAVGHAADAAKQLQDHAVFKEGPRRDLERKARQCLRQAYCDSWGRHDGLRKLTGEAGSQLPLFAPPVASRSLMKDLAKGSLQNFSAAWEARMLLRCALDVYREYQRVLWSIDAPGTFPGGDPTQQVNLTKNPVASPCPTPADTGSATSAVSGTYEGLFSSAGPGVFGDFHVQGGSTKGDMEEAAIEEWHFHRYGPICIMMLDTKGNFCANGIGLLGNRPSLLSKKQWEAFVKLLRDETIRVLIVASDEPLLMKEADSMDSDIKRLLASAVGKYGAAVEDCADILSWRSRPDELCHLLGLLFEWKNVNYPCREVLLLSGGPGFATTGDVCDNKMGLSIPTAVIGPTLGEVSAVGNWQLQGTFGDDGRFTYAHREPSSNWSSCVIDIDCGLNYFKTKPAIDVQLLEIPIPQGAGKAS